MQGGKKAEQGPNVFDSIPLPGYSILNAVSNTWR